MATTLLTQLRRSFLVLDGAGLSDGQLLDLFVEHRDEAAFAALVRRHGPMVWGVCRRLLHHLRDAEDAYQATFLVLARKAQSVRPRDRLASWLHGVARMTAHRAQVEIARRNRRERQVTAMPEPAAAERQLWDDLRPLLDQELGRLPGKYRTLIVLADLEGKTRREIGQQLGCPEGTVAGRLARARALLVKRLARHGLVVTGGSLPTVLTKNAVSAGIPTAQRATAAVTALAEGVLKAMLLTRLKVGVAAVVTAVSLACCGVGLTTHATLTGVESEGLKEPVRSALPKPPPDEEQPNAFIDSILQANGGEEKLRRIRAFTIRWKSLGADGTVLYDSRLFVQLPDRVRIEVDRVQATAKAPGLVLAVCNGNKCWSKADGRETREFTTKADVAREVGVANACSPASILRLQDPAFTLSWLGESKVGERPVVGVELARKDGEGFYVDHGNGLTKAAKLFFDKDTKHLLKTESSNPLDLHCEVLYQEYRVMDGIPRAQKVTRRVDNREVGTTEVVEFKIADKLDDKLFEKP